MKPKIDKYYRPLLLWITLCPAFVNAQDTTRLSLSEAEAIFFKQNLPLLAARCYVDAGKAEEIQAKLYPNPILSTTMNVHDPENRKWFHSGSGGQSTVEIEQLILLGGKRSAALDLAKANRELAEANLKVLLRELIHELRQSVFESWYFEQSLKLYQSQFEQLQLLSAYISVQVEKNNIPVKDLIRIRSACMQLTNLENELRARIAEAENKIKVLLGSRGPFQIDAGIELTEIIKLDPELDSLYSHALRERPEILLAKATVTAAKSQVNVENKQAIPDLTAMVNYDRLSGAFRNEFNAGISIPIPVLNRNQGARKAALHRSLASGYEEVHQIQSVLGEVDHAYLNWVNRRNAWNKVQDIPRTSFEEMLNAATVNYRKGNISLLEFMDLFESTTDAIEAAVDAEMQLVLAAEQLRYATGSPQF